MPTFKHSETRNLTAGGHNILFVAGVETYVPPELAADAEAIGAVNVEAPVEAEAEAIVPDTTDQPQGDE